ncbi:site-specific DNA-methyltransferase [Roseburia hominis]|uniref:site-specific DNA-methyltransferase n=1 Tax=Roseburia hominis TaxID=301301 RepID=UPI0039F6366D
MDNKVPQQINDIVGDNIKKLAQLFPSAVKDGEVDFEALKEELGQFKEVGSEKYELTWAGKKNAKKIALEDVIGRTLKFIPEDSKEVDTTGNLYIEGDNLEVLKLLRQNYYGAIKMIYIDPPYNTGDDYVYKDSFSISQKQSDLEEGLINESGERYVVNAKSGNRYHAHWLSNMYARLKVAFDLLTDDGVIFISIDYNENFDLRQIMEEIFGSNRFVGEIYWESKTKSQNTLTSFNKLQPKAEMIFVYSKAEKRRFNLIKVGEKKYDLSDSKGNYREHALEVMNANGIRGRDTMIFDISDGVSSVSLPEGKQWQIGQAQVEKYKENGDLFIRDNKVIIKMRPEYERSETTEPFWGFFGKNLGTTESAKKELTNLIGVHGFETVKPVEVIKRLIYHGTEKDDIVLDFFSGSATTAHAVMKLNAEDEGHRKFVLVQLPEQTKTDSQAFSAGYKTICDIGKKRLIKAGENVMQEYPDANIDIGFKVFRTADTNIKWNSLMDMGQIDINQMETSPDTIDFMPGAKDVDIVYELMLRQNSVPLSSKIEQIFGGGGYKRTYLYADSYLVCLETKVTNELIDKLAELDPLPIKFIFRDSAFRDDIALKDETFRRLKALIEKNHGMHKMTYTVEFL